MLEQYFVKPSTINRIRADPRYAGAFAYGRSHTRKTVDGGFEIIRVPKEEWETLILCGRCGERMTVRYHSREGRLWPEYMCQRDGIEHAKPVGQRIPGAGIDRAIGDLLVDAVSPMALDVALTVQQELQCRIEEADRLRQKRVERAQYEVDLARRRYMLVDSDNRLVADSLEAEWNCKLRTLLARRSKNASASASKIKRS